MAVLVTRPDVRGAQLTEMLIQAGIFAIHLPLFTIETGRELNDLPNKLSQLKAGDYVFAVSKHAVQYAVDTLKNTGFSWRTDLAYFAVGQRSAEFFASQIERAVLYPYRQESSEGLLALDAMQDLSEKHILILRGNGDVSIFLNRHNCVVLKWRRSNVTSVYLLPTIMQSKSVFVSVQELIGL